METFLSLLLLVGITAYILHKWIWYTYSILKLKDIIKNEDSLTEHKLLQLLIDKIKAI